MKKYQNNKKVTNILNLSPTPVQVQISSKVCIFMSRILSVTRLPDQRVFRSRVPVLIYKSLELVYELCLSQASTDEDGRLRTVHSSIRP